MATPAPVTRPQPAGSGSAETAKKGAELPAKTVGTPVALAILAYAAYRLLTEVVRLPAQTPNWVLAVLFVLLSAAGIGLPIWMLRSLAPRRLGRGVAAAGLAALGLVLWLGCAFLTPKAGNLRPLLSTLADLGKILGAGGIGLALAGLLREKNLLMPAGLFAAVADFVVVNFGTVKQALNPANTKANAVLQAVSAKVPSVHPKLGAGATIGPADFLFLGIFLACAQRFGMNVSRTAWVLTVVLGLSLIVAQMGLPIPALAPMSLAFLVVNWREFQLKRDEWMGTVVVVLAAGGLFAAYFLYAFPKR